MRSIELGNSIFQDGGSRIQINGFFTQVRIRVHRIHRNARRETLVDLQLKRVVSVAAVVLLNPQIRELRIREQRLRARYRGRGVECTATGHKVPEWIRNRRREESVR